ncbi:MAG: DUF2142 domain-containing protein [Alphaproteobacteria bacterium]|nr:DUF2142 domain-containing protein [Alphaproteobacteria bacterium]
MTTIAVEAPAPDAPARAAPAAQGWLARTLLAAGGLIFLLYALVTPPFQAPDEHQHLFRAWQLAHFQLYGERRGEAAGTMLPVGLSRAAAAEIGSAAPHAVRPVPKRPLAAAFARATPVSDTQDKSFTDFLGAVRYSPVGYGPQIAAVWIGEASGASVETIVRTGRILNAALALGLFALALALLPVGRITVPLTALMPMTAASAASLGQDGLVLGSCAILAALAVRARLAGRWTARDLALLALFAAILALTKFIYLPLLALALLPLPARGRTAWAASPLAIAAAALLLGALWLHATAGEAVRMLPGAADPGAQLAFILAHPLGFAATLARTLVARGPWMLLSNFSFAWMTVGPSFGAALLALAALVVGMRRGSASSPALPRAWAWWAWLLALAIAGAIATALYLAGTPLGGPLIDGLQGRYFLPLLPVVGLAVTRGADGGDRAKLAVLLMVAANAFALLTIATAFYTV